MPRRTAAVAHCRSAGSHSGTRCVPEQGAILDEHGHALDRNLSVHRARAFVRRRAEINSRRASNEDLANAPLTSDVLGFAEPATA
eukprot:2027172-Pyramimonas_sp.AAC.1